MHNILREAQIASSPEHTQTHAALGALGSANTFSSATQLSPQQRKQQPHEEPRKGHRGRRALQLTCRVTQGGGTHTPLHSYKLASTCSAPRASLAFEHHSVHSSQLRGGTKASH